MADPGSLSQQLQKRCTDWGAYWRASDAHGVELTIGQATELLREALGVEVEIVEWLHLKPFGYAPGNYLTRCCECGEIKPDLDKRATRCRPCAETRAQHAATFEAGRL